ncbi:MAG: hypothetical protein DRN29_11170, partial [Thermoplasmata archaeon]
LMKRKIRTLDKSRTLSSRSKMPTVAASPPKESKSTRSLVAYGSGLEKPLPAARKAITTQPHLAQIVVILIAVNNGR